MEKNSMKRMVKNNTARRGANFVEYLVLVGVIALAGMVAFQAFGGKIGKATESQGNKVDSIAQSYSK